MQDKARHEHDKHHMKNNTRPSELCSQRGIKPLANSNGARFRMKRSVSLTTWRLAIGSMAHKRLNACRSEENGSKRAGNET